MTFTIEKKSVDAGMRALKASYTFELQQDLRAVHGLDAEKLLADILSTEIIAETNREIINRIRQCAKIAPGEYEYDNGQVVVDSASNPVTSVAGLFDVNVNSDGRCKQKNSSHCFSRLVKKPTQSQKTLVEAKGTS